MCKAIDDMMKEERNEARKKMVADFLANGGTEEDAKRMLKATEEEIAGAKELLQLI